MSVMLPCHGRALTMFLSPRLSIVAWSVASCHLWSRQFFTLAQATQ